MKSYFVTLGSISIPFTLALIEWSTEKQKLLMTSFAYLVVVLIITIYFWIKSEFHFKQTIGTLKGKIKKKQKKINDLKNAVNGQVSYRNKIKEERDHYLQIIKNLNDELDRQNKFMQTAVDRLVDTRLRQMEEKNVRKDVQNNKDNR